MFGQGPNRCFRSREMKLIDNRSNIRGQSRPPLPVPESQSTSPTQNQPQHHLSFPFRSPHIHKMGYALSHNTSQNPGSRKPPPADLLGKWQHILTQKCPGATSTLEDVRNWVTLLCRSRGLPWETAEGLAATIPWDGGELVVRLDAEMDHVRCAFEGSGLVPKSEAEAIFRDMCTFIQVGAPLEKKKMLCVRLILTRDDPQERVHKQNTPDQDTKLAENASPPDKSKHQGPACFQDLVILPRAE